MDKPREPLWSEHWAESRRAKADRRQQNREEWRRSAKNAVNERGAALEVTVEIPAEANGEAGGSRSLAKLRALMADPSIPLHRRLDAAEVVLSFELGPGAAVGADPDQIAATSYQFLNAAVDDPRTPEALRFRALKSVAAVENARAAVKSSAVTNTQKRELLCHLVNSQRSRTFRQAQCWHGVIASGDDWALKPSDEFPWPEGWPGDWAWPPSSFAAKLEHELPATFRDALLSIRATNRPDRWDDFLSMAAAPST